MRGLLSKVLGDPNAKEVKKLEPLVAATNELEPQVEALSNDELRAMSEEFRERLAGGEDLDDILPEVFACVREAARRHLGQRHFDVQIIGGIVLHQGKIAEMKTGEGKTLVATLPVSLNALTGDGVHVITVNDYLARRDAVWMAPVYHALGLSVAVLQHDSAFIYDPEHNPTDASMAFLRPIQRRDAYAADILYGTNHEYGFDYLRDNMVSDIEHKVQRSLGYAIVDEVDNILIDEARTPLIISGAAEENTAMYHTFARLMPRLQATSDYVVDEKLRAVSLTEEGVAKVEKALGVSNIYAPEHYNLTRFLEAALKAHALYRRDRDYVIKDGEIVIVDEFTGRMMFGRRYSEGLHQAIEAKEGVKVQRESVTLATITLQNYFRMYRKLAGMTGTAVTQAEEFSKIYKLDVVTIPTHRPMIRIDLPDQVFQTEVAKFRAVAREIEELNKKGQPVLVGTVSIEKSEYLSDLLKRRGIQHEVLNAKHHEREAQIIARAGELGAVTIATNMAGRGTDIKLAEGVADLGGLHIIGTERHEARRIDNQLRGRSGRQGDPGSSRFYVSFEDDVMRRFAPDWLPRMMSRLGMGEDTPLEHSWVNKALETAQTKVEGHNFDIRKHLVDYDDVMNLHRDRIYQERAKILEGADIKSNILDMIDEEVDRLVAAHVPSDPSNEEWDSTLLLQEYGAIVPVEGEITVEGIENLSHDEIGERLIDFAHEQYERKEEELGADRLRVLERLVMLQVIDRLWVDHLTAVDEMRQGIGLRAWGQVDPLVAYKREAHDMWLQLLDGIREQVTRMIYKVTLAPAIVAPARRVRPSSVRTNQDDSAGGDGAAAPQRHVKIGRNDPCYCGSGRKYKKCHGAVTAGQTA